MTNLDLSLAFYDYLCDVIGTEDVVNTRRHILTAHDHVNSNKPVTSISSGSKAEGLDLDGSDTDIMHVFNYLPVYENTDSVKQLSGSVMLVMDITDCKPGSTQLKLSKKTRNKQVKKWCENIADVTYFSSSLFRNSNKTEYTDIIHGPCLTDSDGKIDLAVGLRCKTWILQAKSWILRSQYSWAKNNVLNAILQFGVLFVPVGCKNSPNIDLEWRISFSYAEKLLIWSFNHVQLLCYALLKILLKDIIKENTGELLCSYFLKTIMLWICEETQSSQWTANTIIPCFMACLNRLIYCVRHKTCAHYFIPENDLFAERFDKQQHSLLLSTLNELEILDWTCLLQTETLMSFIDSLVPKQLPIIQKPLYLDSLDFARMSNILNKERGQHLAHIVNICKRSNNKISLINLISDISICNVHDLSDNGCNDNKQTYNIYRKRLCHLLIGLNRDAVSGWLMLASFFFVNKQYQMCTEILSECLSRFTGDMILSRGGISKEEHTRFKILQRKLGIRRLDFLRKFTIIDVIFTPSSPIVPEEMKILDYVYGIFLPVPSVVFALFLEFLCYHHLGDDQKKCKSLRALEIVIQKQYFIWSYNRLESAHQILSRAHSLKNVTYENLTDLSMC